MSTSEITRASSNHSQQRQKHATFPLSFAQTRLWFLDKFQPGNPAYNIPMALRLQGALSAVALERSFNDIVRRHESLRTTFGMKDGEPVQMVAPSLELKIKIIDLSSTPKEAREFEAVQLSFQEGRTPFDLATGPLIRVTLIKLDPADQLLVVVIHHIVTDGWSMGILYRELSELYLGHTTGRQRPLPELPIQYADFAVWQRDWLSGKVLERQVRYWRKQLHRLPQSLDFPFDRPRPAAPTLQGAMHSFTLESRLYHELTALGHSEEATLFMVLLAAFKVLLHRYTGLNDLVVGSPIAGRTRPELEGLIGFFVNTLVLRTRLHAGISFRQLLARVREATLGAYAHQDIPFEKLVEELQPERNLTQNPLFQVAFTFQNAVTTPTARTADSPAPQAPALTNGMAKFDMTLSLGESGYEIQGFLEYSVDILDGPTMSKFLDHFKILLERIVEEPERAIGQLVMMSLEEEEILEAGWRSSEPTTENKKDICALLTERALSSPSSTAFIGDGVNLSYLELEERAGRLAGHLQRLGVCPEVRVGIYLDRTMDLVITALAVLKAGGAFVPVQQNEPDARLAEIIQDASLGLIVTRQELALNLDARVQRLNLDEIKVEPQEKTPFQNREISPDTLACVLFRSGQAGKPEGVLVPRQALLPKMFGPELSLRESDRIAQTVNLGQEIGALEIFAALGAGATLLDVGPQANSRPRNYAELVRNHHVTVICGPAVIIERLTREFPRSLKSVRLILCTDPMPVLVRLQEALPSDFRKKVFGTSGSWDEGGLNRIFPLPIMAEQKTKMSIGHLAAGTQLYLLDRNQTVVPEGVIGEIYAASNRGCLLRGYAGRPEQTASALVPHLFSDVPNQYLFSTGELARRINDEELEYRGRRDGRLVLRGIRVEPEEIERILAEHPKVGDAGAAALHKTGLQEPELVALIVPAKKRLRIEEIKTYLGERLPEIMRPSKIMTVEKIPRDLEKQINREALSRMAQSSSGVAAAVFVAPRTELEQQIAQIWSQTLGTERVGIHDNFFGLGGHSLIATQVVARISDSFQVDFPLRRLFETPTIAELAKVLEEMVREEGGIGKKPKTIPPLVPSAQRERIPLSFAQQRLWFLDQFEPNSAFYNIPATLRLPGALSIQALQQALNLLVARHESLRTTFTVIEGEPGQVITSPSSFNLALDMKDLGHLPSQEREEHARHLSLLHAQMPFSLTRGPLIRAQLLRMANIDHVLLLSVHHIVSDGWSMEVLFRELSALYMASLTRQAPNLPELRVQYADFAIWQRQWLTGDLLQQQLQYWKKQLQGAPGVIQLPTDRPRPATQVFRGGMHLFSLSVPLLDKVKVLSEAMQATLFMALLAAFKLLLYRYTAQEDLVVGTPIANRTRPDLENLIGFFVNTLVLRTKLDGTLTFRQLLERVREVTLGAYSYQDIPFEKLVEELQPERSLSYNPLFQVMFAMQNMGRVVQASIEQNTGGAAIGTGVAKFDLTSFMLETTQGIQAGLEYNSDLFDGATVARMARHYETLLNAATAEPDRPLGQLVMLSETEIQEIADWNSTQARFDPAPVHRVFEIQAKHSPELPAIDFYREILSYGELNANADVWAQRLRGHGAGPGECIGICMERAPEMIVAVIAVLKTGAAYVPLDPNYPVERLSFMVTDSQALLLLTQERLMGKLSRVVQKDVHVLAMDVPEQVSGSDGHIAADAGPDDLAYVIYTSGSTGRPKGVAMRHLAMANLIQWQMARSALAPGTRTLQFASLSFDVSFQEIFSTLCAHGVLVLISEEDKRDPGVLWRALAEARINRLFLPYVALQQLAAEAAVLQKVPDSLKEIITAGEQLQITPQIAALFGRLKCKFYNQYGPSESHVVSEFELAGDPQSWAQKPPIGRPIPNAMIHILDSNLQMVPVSVFGEVYLGGVPLARDYIHQPKLTSERFLDGIDSDPLLHQRLYRTGDRARYLADGNIEFAGRNDDQVKVRGFRVEPSEIEAVLRVHDSIQEAVVIAKQTENGQRLCAYVVPAPERSVNPQELRGHLATLLPEYMVPSLFVSLDVLPLTPSGKLDRRALASHDGTPIAAARPFVAPRTPTEEALAKLWSGLLGLKQIGVHDNFFELGGHSLLATQVVSRVRENLQVEIPLRRIFEAPTIEQLAVSIVTESLHAKDEQELERLLTELEHTGDVEVPT